ncbi:MAG: DUF4440 domain-containing protein [Candidatus Marinimicrobia bacterium]|nr:DUF4440 domain-containing protein [Candidatus Neomarinimicrobiota bacterium]
MRRITIFIIIFFSILLIGCKSTKENNFTVVRKSIEKSNKDMELAFQNDDINLLMSLYSNDCILSIIGGNDYSGRNDVEKLFNRVLKNHKVNSYILNIEELEVYNNSALERGTFYWFSERKNGEEFKARGRYWILRKYTEQNTWKIHRFIENELPRSDKN